MKGEGDKTRATEVERVVRGLVPNSMGKDGGVQRNGVGQGDAGNATVLGDPRSPIKAVRWKAQLKCLYTNARSLSNKQDELERQQKVTAEEFFTTLFGSQDEFSESVASYMSNPDGFADL